MQEFANTTIHLFCSFVGKCNCHNAMSRCLTGLQKPCDARGQHAGFPAARTRQYKGGLRRPGYGRELFGVQALQEVGGGLVGKHEEAV